MKRIMLLSLVSFLLVASHLSAEPKSTANASTVMSIANNSVKGIVLDKLTKETLAGAVITANNQKVYTDLDGNFSISNLCGIKCELKISMISYEDQIIDIETNNIKNVEIKLQQR